VYMGVWGVWEGGWGWGHQRQPGHKWVGAVVLCPCWSCVCLGSEDEWMEVGSSIRIGECRRVARAGGGGLQLGETPSP
jgi:hypothetical protein